MGKEKKARLHQSLAQQILDADAPRRSRLSQLSQATAGSVPTAAGAASSGEPEAEEEYVGGSLSRKIMDQARQQQEELEEEYGLGGAGRAGGGLRKTRQKQKTPAAGRLRGGTRVSLGGPRSSSGEESDGEFDSEGEGDSRDFCPIVCEEDERAMKQFMSKEDQPRRTLADIIMEKIRDKQTEIASQVSEAPSAGAGLDEKVVTVFKGVGQILSKYRSGKLPKAFKVIPSLSNWEEILYLTEPEKWSAAALFQATRIFASNLSATKAQRFFNLVLLPRVRDDISEYKRLNYHLYMALRKALFKPAAFFKGILLPLCESGTCTLREALIVGSVLDKTSIPMLHSCAALLKISEMDYSGANSIFIRTLLDKKYALPYRVTDAVVFHFLRFQSESRLLPVLWHQSLLTFVQRYKEDMSVEQKEALLELVRRKSHHTMTPEIRREIVNSKCRDLGEIYLNRQRPASGLGARTSSMETDL